MSISKTTWIFGQTGAGKSTIARELWLEMLVRDKKIVWLDGDTMRSIWTDLDFSRKGRYNQNLRVARLAKLLNEQGIEVVVSTILPYKKIREEVYKITNCRFIYVESFEKDLDPKKYPFEKPKLF